jgi:NAD(P)H-hydrate epimerase
VLVLGGDRGMGGAVAMAAEAALRVGAGLVSAVTRPEHVGAILARRPEIMVSGCDDDSGLDALLQRATVIAVGPGLGRSSWGSALFERACAAGKPLVVDADGLHWLARRATPPAGPVIVTPHTGEAATLLGCSAAQVQADRYAAATRLSARFGVAVLKGPGTLIADDEGVGVCLNGNRAMATAGMGDVLTGVIAGVLAQGLNPPGAAIVGACLHSYAADRYVARCGARGLLAADLLAELVAALNATDA